MRTITTRLAGARAGLPCRMACRMATRISLGAALVLAVLAAGHAPARAQAQGGSAATCTFIEIKATSEAGGIDPSLSQLAGKLKRPPFSAWKTFTLLARHERHLARMKPADVSLKLGGKLEALFRQLSQAAGKKDRVSLSLALDDKQGKREYCTIGA
jgi:hypothetical protein